MKHSNLNSDWVRPLVYTTSSRERIIHPISETACTLLLESTTIPISQLPSHTPWHTSIYSCFSIGLIHHSYPPFRMTTTPVQPTKGSKPACTPTYPCQAYRSQSTLSQKQEKKWYKSLIVTTASVVPLSHLLRTSHSLEVLSFPGLVRLDGDDGGGGRRRSRRRHGVVVDGGPGVVADVDARVQGCGGAGDDAGRRSHRGFLAEEAVGAHVVCDCGRGGYVGGS
jgi:hypothetical protein